MKKPATQEKQKKKKKKKKKKKERKEERKKERSGFLMKLIKTALLRATKLFKKRI